MQEYKLFSTKKKKHVLSEYVFVKVEHNRHWTYSHNLQPIQCLPFLARLHNHCFCENIVMCCVYCLARCHIRQHKKIQC
jgi:hypothetical protein